MLKLKFLLCFIIILFFYEVHPLLVANNELVPPDFFRERFLSQILEINFESLNNSSDTDLQKYNTQDCIYNLRRLAVNFPSPVAVEFFDAWGTLPSGVLYGNTIDFGSYDQCVGIHWHTASANGQYCIATIPLKTGKVLLPESKNSEIIRVGICVPDNCSPKVLTFALQMSVSNAYDGALSEVSVSDCVSKEERSYSALDIFAITCFSGIAVLMLLSSIYDLIMSHLGKSPKPILLAFSVPANLSKIFLINTKKSASSVDCLTGLRVLSMIRIVYHHVYIYINRFVPKVNALHTRLYLEPVFDNASVTVDTFLFISGFLVSWIGFRQLDRTNGKLNVLKMYAHRYIRLTPPVAALILFLVSLKKFISTGPFGVDVRNLDNCDGDSWWAVLVYIHNYFNVNRKCLIHTWYLGIDFHLYILSPLLLIPMWKWGKKFAPVLITLVLLSIGCVIGTYFVAGYNDFRNGGERNGLKRTYHLTHTRYSPWIVGFGLAYFMHINRERKFLLPKRVKIIGWSSSIIVILTITFATYIEGKFRSPVTVLEAALNESLQRVSWAMAIGWITFACHFGFGGAVDKILSHPFWQPLARLSYSIYLVHMFIVRLNFSTIRSAIHNSDYEQILSFWSIFGISMTIAILLGLSVEQPFIEFGNVLFRKRGPKKVQITPNVIALEVTRNDDKRSE